MRPSSNLELLNKETVRPEGETPGAETASLIQLTAVLASAGALAGRFSAELAHSTLKGLRGGYSTYHAPLGGLSNRQTLFYVSSGEARVLMLSSGSGCSPMTSSPLISPRLWESGSLYLRYGGLQGPSGRCTCAGHL